MVAVTVLLCIGAILFGPCLFVSNVGMLLPISFDIFVSVAIWFDVLHARFLLVLVVLFAPLINFGPCGHFYNTFILRLNGVLGFWVTEPVNSKAKSLP